MTIDWIAVPIGIAGNWFLPNHRIIAICILLVGNVIWIAWGLSRGIMSIVMLQAVFLILNVRTLYLWHTNKDQQANALPAASEGRV